MCLCVHLHIYVCLSVRLCVRGKSEGLQGSKWRRRGAVGFNASLGKNRWGSTGSAAARRTIRLRDISTRARASSGRGGSCKARVSCCSQQRAAFYRENPCFFSASFISASVHCQLSRRHRRCRHRGERICPPRQQQSRLPLTLLGWVEWEDASWLAGRLPSLMVKASPASYSSLANVCLGGNYNLQRASIEPSQPVLRRHRQQQQEHHQERNKTKGLSFPLALLAGLVVTTLNDRQRQQRRFGPQNKPEESSRPNRLERCRWKK